MTESPAPFPTPAYAGEFRMAEVPPEARPMVEAAMAQARRDAFDVLRDAFKDEQDTDRWTFINYCLTGAMEGHTFWFQRVKYDIGHEPDSYPKGVDVTKDRRAASATIIELADDYLDAAAIEQIMASGKACAYCGIPLKSNGEAEGFCPLNQEGDAHKPEQAVFEVTHETIELGLTRIRNATDMPATGAGNWERDLTSIPHLGQGMRNLIMRADLMHDAGMLDADAYGAILEVALFGEVRY